MRHHARKSTQNTRGGYSEDTQIRAGDNGGYLRASPWTAVTRSNRAVRHRASRHGRAWAGSRIFPGTVTKSRPWPSQAAIGFAGRRAASLLRSPNIYISPRVAVVALSSTDQPVRGGLSAIRYRRSRAAPPRFLPSRSWDATVPLRDPGAGRVVCHGRAGRMSPGPVMAGTGGNPGSPRCWT